VPTILPINFRLVDSGSSSASAGCKLDAASNAVIVRVDEMDPLWHGLERGLGLAREVTAGRLARLGADIPTGRATGDASRSRRR
jgi:hypothetical protein